jgi:hypothetical protein
MYKRKFPNLYKLPIDFWLCSCYNTDTKNGTIKEIKTMKYYVDCGIYYTIFDSYREAEVFCGGCGIHPENIYEESEIEG